MARSKGKKRYAQVGLGGRSRMFTEAIIGPYKKTTELVAFCDVNQGRMDLRNKLLAEKKVKQVPTFRANEFDRMIRRGQARRGHRHHAWTPRTATTSAGPWSWAATWSPKSR